MKGQVSASRERGGGRAEDEQCVRAAEPSPRTTGYRTVSATGDAQWVMRDA